MILSHIVSRLLPLYEPSEARAVAFALLEDAFGLTRTDVYAGKVTQFSAEQAARLEALLQRLCAGEPLQYAIGTARFCDGVYAVTPATLIPRPETEELVLWAEAEAHTIAAAGPREAPLRMLDAGTGSGCIAIALAHRLGSHWQVEAWDVAEDTLDVARRNSSAHGVSVDFRLCDLLAAAAAPAERPSLDLIVSNPPYVCHRERADMTPQVLLHEPARALFVPDDDPLLFYRALLQLALARLRDGGSLLVEVNRAYATATADLFRSGGLHDVRLRHDAFGNPRMVGARKSE